MNSKAYWEQRSIKGLTKAERTAIRVSPMIDAIYKEAERQINSYISDLYKNYAKKGILTLEDLQGAVEPSKKQEFLRKVDEQVRRLGLNPEKVYDERYLFRLNRLQQVKEQIKLEVLAISEREYELTVDTYKEIIKDAYNERSAELLTNGIPSSFIRLDNPVVEKILNSKWEGRHFSESIWASASKLATQLPEMISRDSGNIELIKSLPVILGGGISSGASIQKMSQAIRERFDVSRYEAFRLLRTETNYFFNQAQLQTYIDNGVEEYEIVATLDGRTSDICMREDGKIYKSEEAIVGENYPPYHPNCRTVTRTIYLREIKMIGEQKFNARVERLGEEVNAEEERRKVMEEVIIQTRQSLTDNGVTDTIN